MLDELRNKRSKLLRKSNILEHIAGISTVLTLMSLGAVLGSLSNTYCAKKVFRVSASAFGLSASSLLISSGLHKKTEDELDINFYLIATAVNTKPSCNGCIYASGDSLLPCAIHPIEQKEDCADKILH